MKMQYLCAGVLAVVSMSAQAQSPAAAALPTEPAGISYRYFPRQFVQWVGPELPYSMIELDVDDRGAKPLYDAVLTDRATNKRVHYTNQPVEVAIDTFAGVEVHLVPMQFDEPQEPAKGATYLLRFVTEKNVPVAWQFVQGTDITEQGAGITPVATPTPVLIYREQGAVAGEGTALKVGNVTSVADMWKEISQPPYFVAYRGAISQDVHTLVFAPRAIAWKIEPAAAAVAPGAEWTLASEDGRVLSAHVDSFANGVVQLHETHPALSTSVSVEARQTAAGWAFERVMYGPVSKKSEHTITLTFAPGAAGVSKFEVVAGKKTRLASGELTLSADGGESWIFTQPAWAQRAPVVASQTQTRGAAAAAGQTVSQSMGPMAGQSSGPAH